MSQGWNPVKSVEKSVGTSLGAPAKVVQQVNEGDWKGAASTVADPGGVYNDAKSNTWDQARDDAGHAYQTSVVDPLKEAGRQFQNAKDDLLNGIGLGNGAGGGNGGQVLRDSIPQVAAPTMGPGIAAPTEGFAIAPIAGQQIAFDPTKAYAADAQAAQAGLMQRLTAQSQGQGPSVAEMQLKQAQEANIAATMAQLASARGGANPMLQRQAMTTSADIQAQTARDAAAARMQEQLAAQGLLGQVSGQAAGQGIQARSQDMSLATNQAGLNQDAALAGFNAQTDSNKTLFLAQQQAQVAHADLAAKYAAMGLTAQQANQQAALEVEKMIMEGKLAASGANRQLLGGLASGAATVAAGYFAGPAGAAVVQPIAQQAVQQQYAPTNYAANADSPNANYNTQYTAGPNGDGESITYGSDENIKTNITDGTKGLQEMLSALSASNYEYKDKKHGEGRHTGPMAQELAKTETGSQMVKKMPYGLGVDVGRAALAALSAAAMLQDRISQLEAKKKKGH